MSDKRPVGAADQRATEQNVAQAFGEVFGRQGVKVTADSPNALVVTLEHPSTAVNDIAPESCVEMMGELKLGDGRSMAVKELGCAEFKNALGMSYGGYVSGAFQYAADVLLKYLDEGYGSANDPLVFEEASIGVPAFLDVGVEALALTVNDEFSADGSAGQNLVDELRRALVRSGVRVNEGSSQMMVVTLSHPTEDFAGRDKATCVTIEVRANLARGTAFGQGTSCRGLAGSGHHTVLSQVLEGVWTEYARLGK